MSKRRGQNSNKKSLSKLFDAYGPFLPELIGGSADLAGSNNTIWSDSKGIDSKDASGNYIYYGVREFGMSAIMSGISSWGLCRMALRSLYLWNMLEMLYVWLH